MDCDIRWKPHGDTTDGVKAAQPLAPHMSRFNALLHFIVVVMRHIYILVIFILVAICRMCNYVLHA